MLETALVCLWAPLCRHRSVQDTTVQHLDNQLTQPRLHSHQRLVRRSGKTVWGTESDSRLVTRTELPLAQPLDHASAPQSVLQ